MHPGFKAVTIAALAGLAVPAGAKSFAEAPGTEQQSWQQLSGYSGQPTTLGFPAAIFPPWDPAPSDSKNFTVPEVNNLPDLHGDIVDPQLVVYFAGNQYMVVQELMAAFKRVHPEYQRLFYVTLPPGILVDAVTNHGGAFAIGNLRIALKPDVLTRGKSGMVAMQSERRSFARLVDYADNKLALMVRKGNPKHVRTLADLARNDVRVSMPNPAWEGIARQIEGAYVAAGGEKLKSVIMENKVKAGTTYLTHIHHRELPMRLMAGLSDVAPVWESEALYHASRASEGLDIVELPNSTNRSATYTAGSLVDAPHPQAAAAFLDFLRSTEAQAIYRRYGFAPAGTLDLSNARK